jgi:hypothetical protein
MRRVASCLDRGAIVSVIASISKTPALADHVLGQMAPSAPIFYNALSGCYLASGAGCWQMNGMARKNCAPPCISDQHGTFG